MTDLKEKEFSLIQEVARNSHTSQRELSKAAGLSLGLTNLLLRNLSRKGLVRMRQLDRKKAQYVLTPKGAIEKRRKSYIDAAGTLKQLKHLVDRIRKIILVEYRLGRRDFYVVADGEAREILQMAVKSFRLPGGRIIWLDQVVDAPKEAETVFMGAPVMRGHSKVRLVSILDGTVLLPSGKAALAGNGAKLNGRVR